MAEAKYFCRKCWYCYDETFERIGQEEFASSAFADLPEDWLCPDCGAKKTEFYVIEEEFR
ncbi:rubredoxin [Pseudomonas sp. KU43P]|uniref:rubredoxin n=1 Tax=Pseudomonas sp. KU43P TaxID=2487887 RepID=UPI0012AAA15E|nr:rubredoxin [Pseudomonas sp. KU43P]BBH45422.1 rubredoxin [Pseudomonas sp. KU43P]